MASLNPFKKPKIPGFDTGALQAIAEQTAARQRQIIGGLRTNLGGMNPAFEAKRASLSARILPEQEEQLTKLRQEASGVGEQQATANRAAGAAFREQQFREVPELQRAIRESLGGTGLLQNAAAASTLARPTLEAARSARDFESGLETTRLGDIARREEGLATTGFATRSQAVKDRLGLDEGTIKYLQDIGREDLIREADALGGVEADLGASRLSTETLGQQQNIARAQASAARRGQILSSLGQLGGAGIGFLAGGGPMGAAIGSQIGGQLGGMAGGGQVPQFDPTLLFALGGRGGGATPTPRNTMRSLPYNPNDPNRMRILSSLQNRLSLY